MSFTTPWINAYKSMMKLQQDPITGMLQGTYASTTGGTGTYDVIGWASLQDASPAAGQTMAISILWRSNDGGKSDPSHEVSGMAGQVVAMGTEENLVLLHLFAETDPNPSPYIPTGFYPDKLIFVPYTNPQPSIEKNNAGIADPPIAPLVDKLTGTWIGAISGGIVTVTIQFPIAGKTPITGTITYPDGKNYPIVGFTDIFATPPTFNLQGISCSTYIDEPAGRRCIAMAGYLDLTTNKISLMPISAQSTKPDSTWYQTQLTQLNLQKNQS